MSRTELVKKIKEGIRKSGFPLELKIGSVLEKNKWTYTVGDLYEDFETRKTREIDITASKTINNIHVHLFIECKKSDSKQVVLYAPKSNKFLIFLDSIIKIFPIVEFKKGNMSAIKKLYDEFSSMRHFNKQIPFSQNLIITKGDQVTEDSVNYLSSINGLIKRGVWSGTDGYIDTNHRIIFLYALIFDGVLLQLSSSQTEDFDLKEINYGQLKFKYDFKIDSEYYETENDVVNTAFKFGNQFIIEIMSPSEFEKYIKEIEKSISNFQSKNLQEWGSPWPEFKIRKKKQEND